MILGGPLAFGKKAALAKTFKVPPHYQLRINVQIWKIDSWDYERMIVLADGFQWETIWGHDDEGTALCGAGGEDDGAWKESIYNV
jgi:hypothetical protein